MAEFSTWDRIDGMHGMNVYLYYDKERGWFLLPIRLCFPILQPRAFSWVPKWGFSLDEYFS
jgi:hypothetical protein